MDQSTKLSHTEHIMEEKNNSVPVAKLPSDFRTKMSKDQINSLPIRKWDGKITLVNSEEAVADAVSRLQKETVLGFDTETKPVFRKGVTHNPCILQLAGEHEVTLFQLNRIKNLSPIAGLLKNKNILKVGVGLVNDIDQLQAVMPFEPEGFIDVGNMASKASIQSRGLRSMAARFFGFRISKRAQCSNWEAKNLKNFQLLYAATDAWVSREIYQIMKRNDLIR
ncbi:MAG: 3'-5' exonuclease domain-containing protein 2 [Magnetococcales bacterium]|nr:3'-5' exonuclease domain-containing protein 2 [Magnetococcales bacterium]